MVMETRGTKDEAELGLLSGPEGARLLLSLWDEFPEHMFIIRVDGTEEFVLQAVNPAQQKTLGHQRFLIGKRIEDILPAPENQEVLARYRECVRQERSLRYEETGVYINAEGERCTGRWLTLLVPLSDDSGQVRHLFGVSKNITEVHQARQTLQEQNRLLEERVAERTRALEAANRELQVLASHDFLTECLNRRRITELAEQEIRRARRYRLSLSLALLDIDQFKLINDQHGHAAGDQALCEIARTLSRTLRDTDILGRYGGDEFIVLMPETDLIGARDSAERLQAAVRDATRCRISIGVASLSSDCQSLDHLLEKADRRLLHSKAAGREQ